LEGQSKPTPARHLVTSALPCVDGAEHPGNLAGSLLPADVYARFLRARGESVLFVCATDEHGTPAELAAAEAGLEVAEYCRRRHLAQARLAEELGLSFDVFGRSSSPRSREQTRYFAQRLDEEGFLEARSMRQVFSPEDGRFLSDRCIVGTCPHCDCDHARGDRCEGCGRLLDPTRLVDARSAISGSRNLEARDSRHLFLLQSKLAAELRAWLGQQVDWPAPARSIGLDEGLEDRSITRDLSWGAPVDRMGFEDKVYCAWFDAPVAYIGATREWADARGEPGAWRTWWRGSEDVRYVQFVARDGVPFHAVGFPCTLLGSGEGWKFVDFLKAFDRLTYYGGKFSAGRGGGGFMAQALELLPADCWRYHLLANAPETGDADFSWETFAAAVNEDLAGFGDFVNRSLTFAELHFDGEVPSAGEPGPVELELLRDLDRRLSAYAGRIEALEFRAAIAELRAIWGCGNAYFDRKRPWEAVAGDRSDAALTVRFCVNLVCLFSRLAAPVIPFTAKRVLDALAVPEPSRCWPSRFRAEELPPGHRFSVPPELFRRIGEDDVERWRARFGDAESVDHEAGLDVVEAQAPGRDAREYRGEEKQHHQG
jgi:methionyl-tRNA synthetase